MHKHGLPDGWQDKLGREVFADEDEVREVFEAQVRKRTMSGFARLAKVGQVTVWRMFSHKAPMGIKVPEVLGYQKVEIYLRVPGAVLGEGETELPRTAKREVVRELRRAIVAAEEQARSEVASELAEGTPGASSEPEEE